MFPTDRYYRCACGRLWRQSWTGGFAYGVPTFGMPVEVKAIPNDVVVHLWGYCPMCDERGTK